SSMAAPSATARRVRSVRSGLEAKLRQASNERPGTMILPTPKLNVFEQQPVTHEQNAVGVRRRAGVVRHQDDGLRELAGADLEQVEDLFAGRVVEVAGWLVGEHRRGARHERAGDSHALLLAARKLLRAVVLVALQPHAAQI